MGVSSRLFQNIAWISAGGLLEPIATAAAQVWGMAHVTLVINIACSVVAARCAMPTMSATQGPILDGSINDLAYSEAHDNRGDMRSVGAGPSSVAAA